MNVLSLFDGMSCGRIALDRAGIPVTNYWASEIKKTAIKVALDNYPDIIHVGDVTQVSGHDYPIDLLIGGSPCQDFSLMKTNGEGLEGDKSRLFYEYLRILKEAKPKYFLLENVRMIQASKLALDQYLGVEGVLINSSLVSFQNRNRYYWTNIPITPIEDQNISFQDWKETSPDPKYKLNVNKYTTEMWNDGNGERKDWKGCKNVTHADKIGCLTRKQYRRRNSGLVEYEDFCRFLTREELELAQTVPLGYTKAVTYNQAQDLLGDGWTVDVIAHIFKGMEQ